MARNSRVCLGLPQIPPWQPIGCWLCSVSEALTFHPLRERGAHSWRRSLAVFGMAETWRRHPVGGVLQEGIQEPEAICGFHSPRPQHKIGIMLHFKWLIFLLNRIWRHSEAQGISHCCYSPFEVLSLILERCNFQPLLLQLYTNTKLICSVWKFLVLCTKSGSFGGGSHKITS